ncbi:hypothetical protein QVH35_07025 [Candidatus Nitrosotenuis chungbukensis]|uniref:hypothetical protein n=1 Tax=Candidatus Nitrosotenuis chungbukensis TaxID=1353246 RepID=UPI002670DD04|nr:hypothetical protein [Candidatus Nitrosotenuis chungbukensis]WKT57188.1 hypothetical protein QVH35_07025 [Candidatus Nitrosotenuis chungbukensis]
MPNGKTVIKNQQVQHPEDNQIKIFEPLFTTKQKETGRGPLLAKISWSSIMEQHR